MFLFGKDEGLFLKHFWSQLCNKIFDVYSFPAPPSSVCEIIKANRIDRNCSCKYNSVNILRYEYDFGFIGLLVKKINDPSSPF